MKTLPSLFTGILVFFAASWLGFTAYAYLNLGRLPSVPDEETGGTLPPAMSGLAAAGQKVYAANGCVSCHSQQVRPASISTDIEKKLGVRRTVARDFMRDQPALPGSLRIGPDLTNLGTHDKLTANWLHQHLYEPATLTEGSIMPSYRFLYSLKPITGQISNDAVSGLTGPHAPAAGMEVVPTLEAKALVAYLMSLKRNYPLPEAPVQPPK